MILGLGSVIPAMEMIIQCITPLVAIGNAENFFILMILLKTRAYKKFEFSNTDLGLFALMQLI